MMVGLDNMFCITKMYRFTDTSSLKAICDITIGDSFVVTGIKVVEGKTGLFVSMPRRQSKDGKWRDTVFPINREVRESLSQKVMSAYQEPPQN